MTIQLISKLTAMSSLGRRLSVQLVIICLIIGLSITQILLPQRYLFLLLFAPLGVFLVLILLRWPPLGLVVLIGSILVPISGSGGINTTPVLVGILLSLWLFEMIAHKREFWLPCPPVTKPLLLFIVLSIISFFTGQLSSFYYASSAPLDARLGGLSIFVLSAGTFFLVSLQLCDLRWLKVITWGFLSLASIYFIGNLIPRLVPLTQLFHTVDGGSLFWVWMSALAFSQAVFNHQLHNGWRVILVILVIIILYLGYFIRGDWKSGWLPPLVVILSIISLRSWRVGLVFIVLSIPFIPGLLNQLVASDQYSYSTRIEAWRILGEIIKVNPLLGLGPANYYWYTPLFPIRGYSVQFNSHNNYIDIIAQIGLLGLVSFLWFALEIGRLGWQLKGKVTEGFSRAFVHGALGGLVGSLVAAMLGDWVLPFVYNVGLKGFRSSMLGWLFLGGLVVIEKVHNSRGKLPIN